MPRLLVPSALLAVLVVACSPPAPPELVVPRRALVTEQARVCVPGRDWTPEGDGWRMRGVAEVSCWFGEGVGGATFWWTSHERQLPLLVTWDGEVLDVVSDERQGWRVDVPASLSGPGHHLLEVRRLRPADAYVGLSTGLTGLGTVEDGRRVPFEPLRLETVAAVSLRSRPGGRPSERRSERRSERQRHLGGAEGEDAGPLLLAEPGAAMDQEIPEVGVDRPATGRPPPAHPRWHAA